MFDDLSAAISSTGSVELMHDTSSLETADRVLLLLSQGVLGSESPSLSALQATVQLDLQSGHDRVPPPYDNIYIYTEYM